MPYTMRQERQRRRRRSVTERTNAGRSTLIGKTGTENGESCPLYGTRVVRCQAGGGRGCQTIGLNPPSRKPRSLAHYRNRYVCS